jgi:radical SAM protein with 4Fe4S-binding SPASM domain
MENVGLKYQPVTAVWEITMGCNMRCKHCGSSCTEPSSDELTTDEAFKVIDQMSDLGVRWVTLSGGEPLTRRDLPELIRYLTKCGISANVITNGWLLKEQAQQLKDAGVSTVAISIEGTEDIHNNIRRNDSFSRDMEGIRVLRNLSVEVGVITTISKRNIDNLPDLRKKLIEMGVSSWQVQIGLPMGNMASHADWILEPKQMDDIIDFCYNTSKDGLIRIYPADCIGYYNAKEQEVRRESYHTENTLWDGCNAGIRGFGLLQNGDIIGCTSVRDKEFIEGNIRESSLSDIWNDENSFRWRREMHKEQLSGECKRCVYGSKCLGGCTNTRLTMDGTIYGENKYCSYNNYLKDKIKEIQKETNTITLLEKARNAVKNENVQEAALMAEKVISLDPKNLEAYKLKGYAEFMCGNYEQSEKDNRAAIALSADDGYVWKGLALAIYKLKTQPLKDVMDMLDKANKLSDYKDLDLIQDINLIRQEYLATR